MVREETERIKRDEKKNSGVESSLVKQFLSCLETGTARSGANTDWHAVFEEPEPKPGPEPASPVFLLLPAIGSLAAGAGHLHILKWLRAQGMIWDVQTPVCAGTAANLQQTSLSLPLPQPPFSSFFLVQKCTY